MFPAGFGELSLRITCMLVSLTMAKTIQLRGFQNLQKSGLGSGIKTEEENDFTTCSIGLKEHSYICLKFAQYIILLARQSKYRK